jgi:hypothetical protein
LAGFICQFGRQQPKLKSDFVSTKQQILKGRGRTEWRMFSSLKQAFSPASHGDGMRPFAESLAEELSVLVFGRSFAPPPSEVRSLSRDLPKSHLKLSKPIISKSLSGKLNNNSNNSAEDQAETLSQPHCVLDNAEKSLSTDNEIVSTPIKACVPHISSSADDALPTPPLSSSSEAESPLETRDRRKKKSKGKRRKKGEEENGVIKQDDSSPSESVCHLPDHILIPTFRRVMSQGLLLCLILNGKRSEMTFWIDGDVMRWGKQKNIGKERGQLELNDVATVVDIGPLEVQLGTNAGAAVELGASSLVEKALLLRSFQLLLHSRPSCGD